MSRFLKKYAFALLLSHICIISYLLLPQSNLWMAYDRPLVENGQWWRFITANLVHLGGWHTIMNLASLWLISFIFQPLLKMSHWIGWVLLLYFVNILAMHLWTPHIIHYVGMSGALYGLIAACATAELRLGVKISGVLLIIVGIKIFLPQIVGVESEYDEFLGGAVVEESHIIGFIQGIILGLLWPKQLLNGPVLQSILKSNKSKE
ncbi:MAG: rhombosortase [Kangiella sp.]|nr:rhombosortase [Kangiella sp.]